MPNILIRGLSDEAVGRIDADAAALGLSRNEFLRRTLESATSASPAAAVTGEDWARSAEVFADLGNPSVMDDAWR